MRRTTKEKEDGLIEVALLKYRMNLSQVEIANQLNISAMQVSRMLEKARQVGIVKIEVDTGISTDSVLESKLKERYGLECAVVVNPANTLDPLDALARAAAMHIDLLVVPGSVIGIAGGRMVMRIIPNLRLPLIKHDNSFEVVQLTGGMLNANVGNPVVLLHEFASRFNAKGYFLNTPIYAPQANLNNYLGTSNFHKIDELWKRCDICVGSVGSVGKDFFFYEEGTISDAQMDEAVQKGAVGNAFGRWIDAAGEYVDCELNQMVISLPPDLMQKIPHRVLVCGAFERLQAVRAVLIKKIYNTCVITSDMAAELV